MPQATEELRKYWGGVDENTAVNHLLRRGFILTHDWCWLPPEGIIAEKDLSDRDRNAVFFLIDEWDYGYLILNPEEQEQRKKDDKEDPTKKHRAVGYMSAMGMPPEGMRKELVRAKQNKEAKEELLRLQREIKAFVEDRPPRDDPSDVLLAQILLEDYVPEKGDSDKEILGTLLGMDVYRKHVRKACGTFFALGFFVGGIGSLSAGWAIRHFLR
jgi:hypothetical protein